MTRGSASPGCSGPGVAVVAHPDDETLWLHPLLSRVDTVVVAFPEHPRDPAITAARHALREDFPSARMEFLTTTTPADVLGQSDRRRRSPDRYGVTLGSHTPPKVIDGYRANYQAVCTAIDPYLAQHPTVYTHNPWGEYGHEEHVQVSRAVLDVGARHGNCVWAWDGLSLTDLARTSMRLRADYFESGIAALPRLSLQLDADDYQRLKSRYLDRGAWTWFADYQPPDTMEYVEIMHEGRQLLTPEPVRPVTREVRILARHVRRSPSILRRLAGGGRLREP
jgi:LmbE family N-acetylglucosaminyl deacetylase